MNTEGTDAGDWSIQEIARIAGTTSRTLRHYDDVGLLKPSRIAHNGYRHYDERGLVRLQRILLLRELGLGLTQISEVLGSSDGSLSSSDGSLSSSDGSQSSSDGSQSSSKGLAEAAALQVHLGLLRQEQDRLVRQIAAVESTITALTEGEELMAENMFDGFDHTQYKDEVEQRWGRDAYASSDRWWRGMTDAERADWQKLVADLGRDWIEAAESGIDPASDAAQALAKRHVDWLTGIPGTPAALRQAQGPSSEVKGYVLGLGDMYVADPRFAANYGGEAGAAFVRDALRVYAEVNL